MPHEFENRDALRHHKFVRQYCTHGHGTKAAEEAGYPVAGAATASSRLLKSEKIQAMIKERLTELEVASSLSPEWVMLQWKRIAAADPNELMQLRRLCCRHCHGCDFEYQWTEREFTAAVETAERTRDHKKPAPFPNPAGGLNFVSSRSPHPDCPVCGGDGVETPYFADTRTLTLNGRALYAGIKVTKNGMEYKTRDQDFALRCIADYFGMLKTKTEISGPDGKPLVIANLRPEDLSDEEIVAMLQAQGVLDKQEEPEADSE